MAKEPTILTRAEVESQEETRVSHPLNPNSEMYYRRLTELAGFDKSGLHMVRLPPGKDSNELHRHQIEEEFYFVLSGRAVMQAGDDQHVMEQGSFAAFPAGSVAHMITNPHDEDLVYLVGGSRSEFELGEFPRHGKMLIRAGDESYMVDADQMHKPSWTDADGES